MSDAVLTIAQSLKLLHELATNDQFRERFQEKPAAALVELGIPYTTVVNLNAACLASTRLASKDAFMEAHRQFNEKDLSTQSMVVPHHLKL